MDKLFKWLPNHYYWDSHNFEADHLIQQKLAFLNEESFLIRAALYFLLWNIIVISLHKMSINHDKTSDHSLLKKMNLFSMSPLGVLFFISITFAGFDSVSYTHLTLPTTPYV